MDIKITLAAVRTNAHKTQQELANEMGVTRETINKWENGKAIPSKAQLFLLANVCCFPIENIFLPKSIT